MRRIPVITVVMFTIASGPVLAQRACPHSESDREKIAATLTAAHSCKAAYDLMNACRSNTSGDVEFAEIVIAKCEQSIAATATTRGPTSNARSAYKRERDACRRKYANKQGTMYVSFAATCEAGVAVKYAGSKAGK